MAHKAENTLRTFIEKFADSELGGPLLVLYSEMTPQSLVPDEDEYMPASGFIWIMGPGAVQPPFINMLYICPRRQ